MGHRYRSLIHLKQELSFKIWDHFRARKERNTMESEIKNCYDTFLTSKGMLTSWPGVKLPITRNNHISELMLYCVRPECGTYAVQGGSPVGGAAVGTIKRVESLPERGMVDGRVQDFQRERVAAAVLSVVQRRPPETPTVVDRSVHAMTVRVSEGRIRRRVGVRRHA